MSLRLHNLATVLALGTNCYWSMITKLSGLVICNSSLVRSAIHYNNMYPPLHTVKSLYCIITEFPNSRWCDQLISTDCRSNLSYSGKIFNAQLVINSLLTWSYLSMNISSVIYKTNKISSCRWQKMVFVVQALFLNAVILKLSRHFRSKFINVTIIWL